MLEFTINDAKDAPFTDSGRRGYEQLIRKLMALPGRCGAAAWRRPAAGPAGGRPCEPHRSWNWQVGSPLRGGCLAPRPMQAVGRRLAL